jgi:D-glycero-D-manno-heptose 1,7-bisphosphate phosphatase
MQLQMPPKKVPVLYIDLDGTVRKGFDELGRFVNKAADVELFPRMAERLLSYKQIGWRIVGVSNQGGVSTGHAQFGDVLAAMGRTQELTGGLFDRIMFCIHHPDAKDPEMAQCWCRKPRIALLVMAATDLGSQWRDECYPPHLALFVGDREEDRQCAANAGIDFMLAKDWRQLPFTVNV